MGCCGQKRRALRATPVPPPPPPPPPVAVLQNPVLLAQTGGSAVVVRGAASGLSYLFAPSGAALEVDGRDVAALLETGRFNVWDAGIAGNT